MDRRVALIVPVLALAGAAVFLAWRLPVAEPDPQPEPPPERGTVADRPLPAARSSIAADAPTVDVPVTVLDPATRRPSAGVEVEWRAEFDDEAPAVTGRGTTDATGLFVAKTPHAPRAVSVRIGAGEWVRWKLRATEPDAPIVLQPEPRITLVAVGPGGPVAGVELTIGYRMAQNEGVAETQRSGADGAAVFRVPHMGGEPAPEFFASVQMPLATPLRVPLTIDPPPARPVRIELPPCGSVVVRLVGPDGEPWMLPTQVTLMALGAGSSATGATWCVSKDGVAEFPAIGVGVRLQGLAFPQIPPPRDAPQGTPPTRLATARWEFAGPAAVGRRVTVETRVGRTRPAVVGRVLGANGQPSARSAVWVQVLGLAGELGTRPPEATAVTDANGAFHAELDCELPASGATLRITPNSGATNAPELLRRAWTRADPDPLDVGDLSLPAPPAEDVVVSGRIVRPDGTEQGFVQIYAARRRDGWWDIVSGLTPSVEGDSFALRGRTPDGDEPLFLIAQTQSAVLDAAVEFRPGAEGVELRFVATGGLQGSVRLPPGVEAIGAVDVRVEGEVARGGGLGWDLGTPSRIVMWNGSWFGAEMLRPGRATVVVRSPGRAEPLFRVEGVQIRAGETVRDPRLANLDLTKLAETTTILVTGDDGRPFAGAEVWTRASVPPGTRDVYWSKTLADAKGAVQRAGFGGTFDVVAMAPGFGAAEARGVKGTRKLALSAIRPSAVTVRLAPTVAQAPSPLTLQARIVWCGTAERPVADSLERNMDPRSIAHILSVPVGPDGTARFEVAEPGRWQAMLSVHQTSAGGGRGQPVTPVKSTEVIVTEDSRALEIVVDADPERYAAVCREMLR